MSDTCSRCNKREAKYMAYPTGYGELTVDGIRAKRVCEKCKEELGHFLPYCYIFSKLPCTMT